MAFYFYGQPFTYLFKYPFVERRSFILHMISFGGLYTIVDVTPNAILLDTQEHTSLRRFYIKKIHHIVSATTTVKTGQFFLVWNTPYYRQLCRVFVSAWLPRQYIALMIWAHHFNCVLRPWHNLKIFYCMVILFVRNITNIYKCESSQKCYIFPYFTSWSQFVCEWSLKYHRKMMVKIVVEILYRVYRVWIELSQSKALLNKRFRRFRWEHRMSYPSVHIFSM